MSEGTGRGALRLLALGIAGIALALLLTDLIALGRARRVQSSSRLIVDNMLTSIELVSRVARDIDQKRLLVEAHIFEHESVSMAHIEREIIAMDADYASTARLYEPLSTLPGERGAWDRLQADVATIKAPIASAIELSRQDRDPEARAVMIRLKDRFDAINRDASALIDLNHAGADQAAMVIRRLQRSTTYYLGALALLGLALTTIIGIAMGRLLLRREDELYRFTRLLEERNRDLDAFAGRVAHDLRGPLTTVALTAERLAQSAPEEKGTSAVLQRSVSRMEALIRDLLTLSRVGAQAEDAVCDPASIAAAVRDDLAPRLLDEGGVMHVTVEVAQVRCGATFLHQALWNLVDNAVKYRRPDVQIEIGISGGTAGETFELRVADNGMGMSSDDARQAFDPFYRAARSRETPGTGLGLSIVKRVMEASGGDVSVVSQVGRGTTFVLRLPLAGRRQAKRGGR
jgi:signal transduction histidine kinase